MHFSKCARLFTDFLSAAQRVENVCSEFRAIMMRPVVSRGCVRCSYTRRDK